MYALCGIYHLCATPAATLSKANRLEPVNRRTDGEWRIGTHQPMRHTRHTPHVSCAMRPISTHIPHSAVRAYARMLAGY